MKVGKPSSSNKANAYNCSRCRIHGEHIPVKNHRRVCPYLSCECSKCKNLLEYRQISNQQKLPRSSTNSMTPSNRSLTSDQLQASGSNSTNGEEPEIISALRPLSTSSQSSPSPSFTLLDINTAQPPMRPMTQPLSASIQKPEPLISQPSPSSVQFPSSTFRLVSNDPRTNPTSDVSLATSFQLLFDSNPSTPCTETVQSREYEANSIMNCQECREHALLLVQSIPTPTPTGVTDYSRLAEGLLEFVARIYNF
ncbi:Doublesex and mab 3 transcription [Aphelenchoides besseyi]|nr:Doublesex and mab 3 transcription [Aphelenchoides besseyi]